jgi:membrane associated rhomboid family serine protease
MSPAVRQLAIVNAIVFVASLFLEQTTALFALYYPTVSEFQPYQLVTYMFTHANLPHFFFNMFALVSLGTLVESRTGTPQMFVMYFLCGWGAIAAHWGLHWWQSAGVIQMAQDFLSAPAADGFDLFVSKYIDGQSYNKEFIDRAHTINMAWAKSEQHQEVFSLQAADMVSQVLEYQRTPPPVVGASGSVYGILMAFAMLFPKLKLSFMFIPIGIEARFMVPLLMVMELFLANAQFAWDNIGHYAHLGGAITGMLIILLIYRRFFP